LKYNAAIVYEPKSKLSLETKTTLRAQRAEQNGKLRDRKANWVVKGQKRVDQKRGKREREYQLEEREGGVVCLFLYMDAANYAIFHDNNNIIVSKKCDG